MTATVFSTCPRCGFVHETAADRLACDARHGRRWPMDGIANPYVVCALCGTSGELDLILDHMQMVESRRQVTSGRLIRTVMDTANV
jgi:hypothetical protein